MTLLTFDSLGIGRTVVEYTALASSIVSFVLVTPEEIVDFLVS